MPLEEDADDFALVSLPCPARPEKLTGHMGLPLRAHKQATSRALGRNLPWLWTTHGATALGRPYVSARGGRLPCVHLNGPGSMALHFLLNTGLHPMLRPLLNLFSSLGIADEDEPVLRDPGQVAQPARTVASQIWEGAAHVGRSVLAAAMIPESAPSSPPPEALKEFAREFQPLFDDTYLEVNKLTKAKKNLAEAVADYEQSAKTSEAQQWLPAVKALGGVGHALLVYNEDCLTNTLYQVMNDGQLDAGIPVPKSVKPAMEALPAAIETLRALPPKTRLMEGALHIERLDLPVVDYRPQGLIELSLFLFQTLSLRLHSQDIAAAQTHLMTADDNQVHAAMLTHLRGLQGGQAGLTATALNKVLATRQRQFDAHQRRASSVQSILDAAIYAHNTARDCGFERPESVGQPAREFVEEALGKRALAHLALLSCATDLMMLQALKAGVRLAEPGNVESVSDLVHFYTDMKRVLGASVVSFIRPPSEAEMKAQLAMDPDYKEPFEALGPEFKTALMGELVQRLDALQVHCEYLAQPPVEGGRTPVLAPQLAGLAEHLRLAKEHMYSELNLSSGAQVHFAPEYLQAWIDEPYVPVQDELAEERAKAHAAHRRAEQEARRNADQLIAEEGARKQVGAKTRPTGQTRRKKNPPVQRSPQPVKSLLAAASAAPAIAPALAVDTVGLAKLQKVYLANVEKQTLALQATPAMASPWSVRSNVNTLVSEIQKARDITKSLLALMVEQPSRASSVEGLNRSELTRQSSALDETEQAVQSLGAGLLVQAARAHFFERPTQELLSLAAALGQVERSDLGEKDAKLGDTAADGSFRPEHQRDTIVKRYIMFTPNPGGSESVKAAALHAHFTPAGRLGALHLKRLDQKGLGSTDTLDVHHGTITGNRDKQFIDDFNDKYLTPRQRIVFPRKRRTG